MTEENKNFVQLSRQYLKDWRGLIKKSPLAAEILMFLVEKATSTVNGGNAVVCSYQVLQEITGYKRSSVAAAIKTLKLQRWIESIRIGASAAYVLNERVVWRGASNGRQYAVFSATIISSSSEQGELTDKTKLRRVPVLESGEVVTSGDEELPPPDQKDLDIAGEIGDSHLQKRSI